MHHAVVIDTCMKVDGRLLVRHGFAIPASSKKQRNFQRISAFGGASSTKVEGGARPN